MSNSIEKKEEIEIISGHDTGSCFWIMPVKAAIDDKTAKLECKRLTQYEISIEEDDVFDYLAYFLFKHFDGHLPENKAREFVENFDWNLEHNFYTRNSVIEICLDMEQFMNILADEADDDVIRMRISNEYPPIKMYGYNQIDMAHNIFDGRYTLSAVIRFYIEFIGYIGKMLFDCKEGNLISFMGP